MLQPILGEGLFLAEGEAWRHQRRTIAPALAPRTMPILAGHVLAATAAKEAELLRLTHRPVELLPHLQHLALSIAGQSMFSLEMSGFAAELREPAVALRHRVTPSRRARPDAARRACARRLIAAAPPSADRWLAFLDRLIAARRQLSRRKTSAAARPVRPALGRARDPETGAGFGHAQLRDEVSTMILAGHETTAVTLFWSCYLAALYPDQQDATRRRGRRAARCTRHAMPHRCRSPGPI